MVTEMRSWSVRVKKLVKVGFVRGRGYPTGLPLERWVGEEGGGGGVVIIVIAKKILC